eukprot:scaffold102_cov133-Isochrysis_galbana.AAC.11
MCTETGALAGRPITCTPLTPRSAMSSEKTPGSDSMVHQPDMAGRHWTATDPRTSQGRGARRLVGRGRPGGQRRTILGM